LFFSKKNANHSKSKANIAGMSFFCIYLHGFLCIENERISYFGFGFAHVLSRVWAKIKQQGTHATQFL
jgi:hypothetical protein